MGTETCANPDCEPDVLGRIRNHWVQIQETQLAGTRIGEGPEQHLFAAVTCSKRCAAAVLLAAADVDDAASARRGSLLEGMFSSSRPE